MEASPTDSPIESNKGFVKEGEVFSDEESDSSDESANPKNKFVGIRPNWQRDETCHECSRCEQQFSFFRRSKQII